MQVIPVDEVMTGSAIIQLFILNTKTNGSKRSMEGLLCVPSRNMEKWLIVNMNVNAESDQSPNYAQREAYCNEGG